MESHLRKNNVISLDCLLSYLIQKKNLLKENNELKGNIRSEKLSVEF